MTQAPIQPQLFDKCANPLRHGAAHYVPVVQNKKGELDALIHTPETIWDRLTPLVSFLGPRDQTGPLKPGTVSGWVRRVHKAVGQHACYVDLLRLKPNREVATTQPKTVLSYMYDRCHSRGINFIPVAPIDGSAEHLDQVAGALHREMRGVALRVPLLRIVPTTGSGFPTTVKNALERLRARPESVDLLLDLEYLDCALRADDIAPLVRELAEMHNWRNVILVGTSIPMTLSGVPEGKLGWLPRYEWQLWREFNSNQKIVFGDYCVQHPKPPQEKAGLGMRANIRYTTDSGVLVARGWGPVTLSGNGEYVTLCRGLVAKDEFAGESYSWGDETIAKCARGELDPGSQEMWRGAGTSHHITFVTKQIAQLPRTAYSV